MGIYAGKNAKGEAVWIHENSNDSNVAMNTVSYWSGYYRLNMMGRTIAMNEQNEFIKNYLHTEYVGCLKNGS